MRGIGHFGAYVPATERSYITTPGRVESAPNATAGMHARISRMSGLGTTFSEGQTNWIDDIANEYVVAAGVGLLLLLTMK